MSLSILFFKFPPEFLSRHSRILLCYSRTSILSYRKWRYENVKYGSQNRFYYRHAGIDDVHWAHIALAKKEYFAVGPKYGVVYSKAKAGD